MTEAMVIVLDRVHKREESKRGSDGDRKVVVITKQPQGEIAVVVLVVVKKGRRLFCFCAPAEARRPFKGWSSEVVDFSP